MDTSKASPLDQSQMISPGFILAIILIEGFITISVEILTIRQLIPFAGSSVTVTSLIIGVFLLFLAYGYKRGGTQTDNFAEKLNFNFTASALILGLGLSYAFIDIYFIAANTTIKPHLLFSLSFYLLIITAPLVYLLGQTVPITMNLIRQTSTVGEVGGKVLHLSTVGSFLGAVLTSVLLMNTLGVSLSVFANYLLLLLLVVIVTFCFKLTWYKTLFLIAAALPLYKINVEFEHLAFVRTNSYANYATKETKSLYNSDGKVFMINNTPASFTNEANQAFAYVEKIKKFIYNDLRLENADILVLGAGGFTLSKGAPWPNHFTYVDIDPEIKQIVEQNFISKIDGKVIAQDARVFVKSSKEQYDAIIGDVYNDPSAMPSHLTTQEYFQDIHNRLKDNGTAFFNFIIRPKLSSKYAKRMDNTVRSVFKSCMSIPVEYLDRPTNVIYVCSKLSNEKDEVIYTDDLNLSELDTPLPY